MLELRGASVKVGTRTLLTNVSTTLVRGSVSVFVGPSGGGKSTLLRSLAGIQPLDEGELLLDGAKVDIGPRSAIVAGMSIWPKVGLVFQQLFLWPHLRIRENLTVGAEKEIGEAEIDRLASQLNFGGLLSRYPNEVSVGQRQRVALARAVLVDPRFLLLDEITSAQDAKHISSIAEVVHEIILRGAAVAIVTHHMGFASELMQAHATTGSVHLVEDGKIVASDRSLDVSGSMVEKLGAYLAAESRYAQSPRSLLPEKE